MQKVGFSRRCPLYSVLFALTVITLFPADGQTSEAPGRLVIVEDTDQETVLQYTCDEDPPSVIRTDRFAFSIPFDVSYEIELLDYKYNVYDRNWGLLDSCAGEGSIEGVKRPLGLFSKVFVWHDVRMMLMDFMPTITEIKTATSSAVYRSVKFRVKYGDDKTEREPFVASDFEELYEDYLANYEMSKKRRGRVSYDGPDADAFLYQKLDDGDPPAKFTLVGPDLYKIAIGKLGGLGLSTRNKKEISIWRDGNRVPTLYRKYTNWKGEEEEYLLFYHAASNNPLSDEVTYWVTDSAGHGRFINSERLTDPSLSGEDVEAYRETITLEKDNLFPKKGEGPSRWFWDRYSPGKGVERGFRFDLPGLLPPDDVTREVEISFHFYSKSVQDFVVDFKTSGGLKTTLSSSKQGNVTFSFKENSRELDKRDNVVNMAVRRKGRNSFVYFDRMEIEYVRELSFDNGRLQASLPASATGTVRRMLLTGERGAMDYDAFDVTDSENVLCLSRSLVNDGNRLLIDLDNKERELLVYETNSIPEILDVHIDSPSHLRDPNNGCDQIIISHADFVEPLKELREYRARQNTKVIIVDLQDIYDEFSHGNKSLDAIRDFIMCSLANWTRPLPSYLLFVGDSNWDVKGKKGSGIRDFFPTYMSERTPHSAAVDSFFTEVGRNATIDHMMAGRIAVQKREEVVGIVDKIKEYEQNAKPGWWKSRILLLSDDGFEKLMGDMAHTITSVGGTSRSIRQIDYPYFTSLRLKERNHNAKFCFGATEKAVSEIDKGCLGVFYMGHGGAIILGHERFLLGTERGDSDILKMDNAPMYPFFYSMSCLTGLFTFDEPVPGVSIAEEWLRRPSRGGIGGYYPTGYGGSFQHVQLAEGIIDGLFDKRLKTFGELFSFTKLRYWTINDSDAFCREYIYFGDPACRIQSCDGQVLFDRDRISANLKSGSSEKVSVRVEDTNLQKANAEIRLLDAMGEVVWSYGPSKLNRGRLEIELPLDEIGEIDGQLSCYVWDQRSGRDAIGSMTSGAGSSLGFAGRRVSSKQRRGI